MSEPEPPEPEWPEPQPEPESEPAEPWAHPDAPDQPDAGDDE